MKRQIAFASVALAAAMMVQTAAAQYSGPGAREIPAEATLRTVAEVLRKPVDDQHVELAGTLLKQTGRETFLFRDDTGEIQVEIDREDFPGGQQVNAETRVILHGEVETRLLRAPEIDVETLQIAAATAGR